MVREMESWVDGEWVWDMRWRRRFFFVGTCLSGIVIGGVGCEIVVNWGLIIGLGSLLQM